MTHLNIQQSSNVEIVSANLIQKLYEVALTTPSATLVGNLLCEHCHLLAYDYLTETVNGIKRFPDLSINVTSGIYMSFIDAKAEEYFAGSPIGDGTGVLILDFRELYEAESLWKASHNNISPTSEEENKYCIEGSNRLRNYFGSDDGILPTRKTLLAQVQRLDELKYTNISDVNPYNFNAPLYMTNLKSVGIPRNCTRFVLKGVNNKVLNNLEYIDFSLADHLEELVIMDTRKLAKCAIPPSVTTLDGIFVDCLGLTDVFAYSTNPNSITKTDWILPNYNVNFWVNDSAYSAWQTWMSLAHVDSDHYTLRRFSDYTGDDLILKWVVSSL